MIQNGRKSAAALAVAPVSALSPLPEPPTSLTEAQADVWRMVMATCVSEMIDAGSYPLLAEYCRAVVTADQIAVELNRFHPSWLADDDGLKRWDKLTAMQSRAQGILATLAMKLRINPASRYRGENAGTKGRKHSARKPWQDE